MVYTMRKKNGTAVAFMLFVRRLIVSGWLQEGDVICLDNARIHTGGEAVALEGLLAVELRARRQTSAYPNCFFAYSRSRT
jgi:hypothetical protein